MFSVIEKYGKGVHQSMNISCFEDPIYKSIKRKWENVTKIT